jgi:Nif-specific regulatory protein
VLLADQPFLEAADIERFLPLKSGVVEEKQVAPSLPARQSPLRPYGRVDSHSVDVLLHALQQCGGNKSRAAQLLGMTARQFDYRWKKLRQPAL